MQNGTINKDLTVQGATTLGGALSAKYGVQLGDKGNTLLSFSGEDVALSGYDWSGYHNKTKKKDAGGLYVHGVTETVNPIAPSQFHTRWVDFANLTELRELLESKELLAIAQSKTLNDICSYQMVDEGRAAVVEAAYGEHIAKVYEEALKSLGLGKKLFGGLKKDVWFCQIYEEIRNRV